tara:strand:- start:156 stop:869 length:714 start_codon:yes stop_codon:yes gene_type:complete
MKKTLICSAVASSLFAGAAFAELSADGSVSATSDYRFRGISQTNEEAALQGEINLNHSSGIHAGVWGSSIDFGESADGENFKLEVDYTVGYAFAISGVDLDLGYVYYSYPNSNDDTVDADFGEVYGNASYKGFEVGVNWSDDYFQESGKSTYVYTGASHKFGIVTVAGTVGYTFFDEKDVFETGTDKYVDYSVSAAVDVLKNLNVEVAYVGTDLHKDDIGGADWAEDTFVASVTLSL